MNLKKITPYLLFSILLISIVSALSFGTLFNPFTGKLDYYRTDVGNTSDDIVSLISLYFVNSSDWTTIDDYPSICSAGKFVTGIGDTLSCSTPSYTIDTNTNVTKIAVTGTTTKTLNLEQGNGDQVNLTAQWTDLQGGNSTKEMLDAVNNTDSLYLNHSTGRIDFPSVDVSIVPSTNTWLRLIATSEAVGSDASRNLHLYNLLARNLIELSGQAKLIFGYTDTDKFIRYNSTRDAIEFVVDQGTAHYAFTGGDVVVNDKVNSSGFYYNGILLTPNTDSNASTICSGTTTYLDGDGNCDDISSVYYDSEADLTGLLNDNYVDISGDTMTGNLQINANLNISQNITVHDSSIVCNSDGSVCYTTYVNSDNVLVTEQI